MISAQSIIDTAQATDKEQVKKEVNVLKKPRPEGKKIDEIKKVKGEHSIESTETLCLRPVLVWPSRRARIIWLKVPLSPASHRVLRP